VVCPGFIDLSIYREGGRTHLLYSVAGEHGIAIAELREDEFESFLPNCLI
jgi:hypothetical protein